ncbi:hypothetical protein EV426DRAFT_153992 [Tirmania nivea]|nr:hypothetical protein EV426DRAFT_153992 [Tirmania nivea]
MATITEPRSRSRPATTNPTQPSRTNSAQSPSPARSQVSAQLRSEDQNRRSVGSVSVFSVKNKLRKNHPLASAHSIHNPEDDDLAIKSALESDTSSASTSTPPAKESPANHVDPTTTSSSILTGEAARIVRRASPGYAIARPNSSLSLLKPTATKAQKVRGLRGASRAVRMKVIRAFGKLFFAKGSKDRRESNGRIEAPQVKKQRLFVRLFVPKRFLKKGPKGGKGKEREGMVRMNGDVDVDGRKDSKLALDSPNGSTAATNRHNTASPTDSIMLREANYSPTDSPKKGILRLRLKKDEQQQNGHANRHANGDANGHATGQTNGHAKESNGMPAGDMLVEDPIWAAKRKSFNSTRDPQTPPRTPNRDNSEKPIVKGKTRDHDSAPNSKSLITAYESGFVLQDKESRGGRKLEQGESWFKAQNEQSHLQVPSITPPQNSVTPPPLVRTPPHEIGLAITTDDVSIISEISRKSSIAGIGNGFLSASYLSGYESDEEKRISWRIPNNLSLEEPIRRSQNNPLQDSPSSVNTIMRVRDSASGTPTRLVTSPTSRLNRSPVFGGDDEDQELVEFNVLVRPGDALYEILVEQQQQSQDLGEIEVDSEIEYFTADENESGDVSEVEQEDEDRDDVASMASGAGTIRAVEIESEGGTMRGVEIVGKKQRKGKGGDGGWGFADVLMGSRR